MKFKLLISLLVFPFSLMAATNQFSNVLVNDTLRSSNTFVRGYLGVTTNGPLSGSTTVVIRPRSATPTLNQLELIADGVGNTASFRFGDFLVGPVGLLGTDGGGNARLNLDAVGTFTINVEGEAVFTTTESSIIYGNNSSDTHTWNGSTWTTAHPLSWNSGLLSIPLAGGTISNNTSFTSINMLMASNGVFTTTDGSSVITSGTNLTMRLISAGRINLEGTFTASTNTPAGINPTMNVMNTNGNQRLFVNIACAFSANSSAFIFSSTANGPKNKHSTSIAETNSLTAWINPGSLWCPSNNVGTVVTIPGEGHVEVH